LKTININAISSQKGHVSYWSDTGALTLDERTSNDACICPRLYPYY